MTSAKWIWLAFVGIVYASFWVWYGGDGEPLTEVEANNLLSQMEQIYGGSRDEAPEGSMAYNLARMAPHDDGQEFYAVNLEQLKTGPDAEAADQRYARTVFSLLLERGGHPVFVGDRVGLMLGSYGREVDRVAVVRYRSLRDLFDMILDPAMQEGAGDKFASLESTEVFIVRPYISFVQVRLLVGLILTLIAVGGLALIGRLVGGKKSLQLDPENSSNGRLMTDPPALLRHVMRRMFDRVIDPNRRASARARAEDQRIRAGASHVVEYFHQHDDPYSHLASQVLGTLCKRCDIELVQHEIRASGGKNQPELAKLDSWARRDAEMVAPYYGLLRPSELGATASVESSVAALDRGSERLAELGHYSGAMFYYAGEWYWGVDRLFHLEQRLRGLGICGDPSIPYICPRPEIDVGGVDASALTLDFYPSLNSPYTAIIYDKVIELARECGIQLNHKPVLPMIMRGVPATREKGKYIMFDAKREAEHLGVGFGPVMTPIGEPTRQIYSLLGWAREQGLDTCLMSAALGLAFREGVGLHRKAGLKRAVEQAGLSWSEAKRYLGQDFWKDEIARNQIELSAELGLWGVPSYRLRGGDGEDDLCVWGQDRLWLIAAEIRRRGKSA